jgi:hypothetical protein
MSWLGTDTKNVARLNIYLSSTIQTLQCIQLLSRIYILLFQMLTKIDPILYCVNSVHFKNIYWTLHSIAQSVKWIQHSIVSRV